MGLLVLTRKPQQSIMVGDDIELTVLSIHGDKVRLGVQAPSDVPVHRTEIYLEIKRTHGEAGATKTRPARRTDDASSDRPR